MKSTATYHHALKGLALGIAFLAAAEHSRATPYASGVTNNSGTIQFILNESADNVYVLFDNSTVSNNLGAAALSKGLQTFSLGAYTNYSINVFKVGAGSPTQISVDTSNTVKFNAPRGVAVNANPKDRHFGLIYGANSTAGGSGLAAKARGIYIFNADTSDAYGRGATASGAVFNSGSANSPYRLGIGPDQTVYAGDFSTVAATVWKFDPDVIAPATWTNVLGIIGETAGIAAGYHGDISGAPCVSGSLATGDLVLYTADAALPPLYNAINKYVIGAGPIPYSNAPVQQSCIGLCGIAELNTDMALAPDGKLFGIINRANTAFDVASVIVYAPDGTTKLWDSITGPGGAYFTGPDVCLDGRSISVSPNGKWMAVMHTDNHITVMRLTNGVPDSASLFTIPNLSIVGNGRQIAWDAAENIYTVSSGQGLLRVISLGATTTAITSNDSTGTNGTFSLTTPATAVSVTATTPDASQSGPTPGVFTVTRSSAVPADLTQPLTVGFTLGGTATNGTYTVSGATTTNITFAANQTSTNITITPVNDGQSRPTTTVIITLKGGGNYSAEPPVTATINIINIGPQYVFISGVSAASMYKAYSNDYVSFVLTRWGDTNATSYNVANYNYSGTAVLNTDYLGANPIAINPGEVLVTNIIPRTAIPPSGVYTGNRTITVGLGAGAGFTPGTNTATMTLVDNANPVVPVLWSDPLTSAADASHWAITYGTGDPTNSSANYNVDFGYDLTTDPSGTHGIISLPPSGATTALRITCNKLVNPGAAGGVNVYYTNQAFSGNYAVRFNMNLIEGGNLTYATEGVLFGINHTTTQSNWWYGSGPITADTWGSDGIWYWVSADPGGAGPGDFLEFTGAGGTNGNAGWTQVGSQVHTPYDFVFKVPELFTTQEGTPLRSGVPANGSPLNNLGTTNWSDVEIKQINNIVSLSINKNIIFTYTNTTVWKSGYLMLGYADPYGGTGGVSIGNPDAAAYFSNLRVVSLALPAITSIAVNNKTNVVVKFVSYDGTDTAASFALQSSSLVQGPYADNPAVTITQLLDTSFQATLTSTNSAQFYRIRHK
jgi:hypothetical protein